MNLRGVIVLLGGLVFLAILIMVTGSLQTAAALDFSAEWIVKRGQLVVTAHVNAKDDRWRFEYAHPQQGASIMIVRTDQQHSWLILSKRRQYLEIPIANNHLLVVTEKMNGEVSRELIGEEILNGHPTELFEVTVVEQGEPMQFYRWVTKAERFPLKTVGKKGQWSEEFRRPIFTEQSPFLFELPLLLNNANPAGIQHQTQ
jgi:hypothetical protein